MEKDEEGPPVTGRWVVAVERNGGMEPPGIK